MQIIQLAWKPTEKIQKVENKISQLNMNHVLDTVENSSILDKPNLFLAWNYVQKTLPLNHDIKDF